MNKKYIYRTNLNDETDYIVCEEPYDFGDWLRDNGVEFVQMDNVYYVTVNGEITGEFYVVISDETTDEDLVY